MKRSCPPVVLYLYVLVIVATGQAQEQATPMAQQVIVGIKEAPPFAMKQADTTWEGISIELWRAIAQDLQLSYEWRERDLLGLLQGVAEGALDVAVGALTITADREKRFDFTHPFYITGLAIAVPAQPSVGLFVRVQRFLARPFLEFVAWLGLVLLGVGTLIWLCEHRRNPQQFGGGCAASGPVSGGRPSRWPRWGMAIKCPPPEEGRWWESCGCLPASSWRRPSSRPLRRPSRWRS